MKNRMLFSSAILALIGAILLSGCGSGDSSSSESSFPENFTKYNSSLKALPSDATYPEDNIASPLDTDWVITQKNGTTFYFSEFAHIASLLTITEAKDYCNNFSFGEGNTWRLPTNNELLVISELYPIDAFFWSSDTTDIVFTTRNDSVNLKEKFVCQAQYVYNLNTEFGTLQQYCNEQLTGKYAICATDGK